MMFTFYFRLDGGAPTSFSENARFPIEGDAEEILARLNGENRWATVISRLPDGIDMYSAKKGDFHSDQFLQAGGSSERMLIQVSKVDDDGTTRMYNLGHSSPDTAGPPQERVKHGKHSTFVYPEEIWTAQEAIPIFAYYFRNEQTIPAGVSLRWFDVDNPPTE